MKTFKFIFVLIVLLFVICADSQQTETVDLKIVVTNINTLEGSIEMGVFNTSKTFLLEGKEYKSFSQKVTSDSIIFYLNGFKKDNYAISLYHDINSDKECNLGFLGIPKEPYGFSKNFKPKFSKPSFDDCKINAYEDISISIGLID